MKEIINVDVRFSHRFGSRKWFEAVVTFEDFTKKNIDIPLKDLQERNVTKTLNGWKKLESWILTDEGWAYIKTRLT